MTDDVHSHSSNSRSSCDFERDVFSYSSQCLATDVASSQPCVREFTVPYTAHELKSPIPTSDSSHSDDSFTRSLEEELNAQLMSQVCAVESSSRKLILFDSGSDEHVCNQSFAPSAQTSSSTDTAHTMRDAQGNIIPSAGQKSVNFCLPDMDSPILTFMPVHCFMWVQSKVQF